MNTYVSVKLFNFLPWYLEEEDDVLPKYNDIFSLKKAENDFLSCLEEFIKNNKKTKSYKFIGFLLNAEISSFEKELKRFILENRKMLSDESGHSFLIFHEYIEDSKSDAQEKLVSKTYSYIKKFDIERTKLPAIILFPGSKMVNAKNAKNQSTVITIDTKNSREGELDDYFTIFFRCLFDTVDLISITEKNPIARLQNEFYKKIKRELGYDHMKEAVKIVNLPIVGNIIKLISLAF